MRALVMTRVACQFDLQLPGEYGVFYDAGIAGDWRVADGDGRDKPTRIEALKYYRKGASITGWSCGCLRKCCGGRPDGAFTVVTETESGREERYHGKKIVVATGYYDLPNEMGRAGRASAACDALLHGAASVLESGCGGDRRKEFGGGIGAGFISERGAGDAAGAVEGAGKSLKYWVRPDIENRIKAGRFRHSSTRG